MYALICTVPYNLVQPYATYTTKTEKRQSGEEPMTGDAHSITIQNIPKHLEV